MNEETYFVMKQLASNICFNVDKSQFKEKSKKFKFVLADFHLYLVFNFHARKMFVIQNSFLAWKENCKI